MGIEKGPPGNQKSIAAQKIEEYADRIRDGEAPEKIKEGLGDSWQKAIDERLQPEPLTPEHQEALADLKEEYIRSSRAMRPSETVEEYRKEREESWKQEEQKLRAQWSGDADLSKSEQEQKDQGRIAELRGQLGAPKTEQSRTESTQVELQQMFNEIWRGKRNSLTDSLFEVSKGHLEDEQGNEREYELVSSDVGEYFNAHGIAKGPYGEQFKALLNLLNHGIDESRNFYTAPFKAPEGAGGATADGSAYKDGIAVLSSGFGEGLSKDGIKHVFINDTLGSMVKPLQAAYPQYQFHLLSEQKDVLEKEVKEATKQETK